MSNTQVKVLSTFKIPQALHFLRQARRSCFNLPRPRGSSACPFSSIKPVVLWSGLHKGAPTCAQFKLTAPRNDVPTDTWYFTSLRLKMSISTSRVLAFCACVALLAATGATVASRHAHVSSDQHVRSTVLHLDRRALNCFGSSAGCVEAARGVPQVACAATGAQCGGETCSNGAQACSDAAYLCCPADNVCTRETQYYWQCQPVTGKLITGPATYTAKPR